MTEDRILRWGILGTANIATKVSKAIQSTSGCELTTIGSRDLEKAKAWGAKHGVPNSVGSYQAVIDDPNIDVIYLPLPPNLHFEWIEKAAKAGKHLLVEKPVAISVSAAREMVDAARSHNVHLMDGVMWVHHPRTQMMKAVVDSGELGTLRRMTSAFSFCWNPLPTSNIRFNAELGGGSLLDLGWYTVGATLLLGCNRLPQRVQASARWFQDVDVSFSGMMWFEKNFVASFDTAFDTATRRWLEIAGTEKSIVCDDFVLPWTDEETKFWVHGDSGQSEKRTCPPTVQQNNMIADFRDLILGRRKDNPWIDWSLKVQQVCDALALSARKEQPIELREDK
ncbi:MAG: Gfo/Idh/MocA family oxidoreductase [Planctomycetaceae bacterium]|nr:Gfo/Idh/MocA family oxidoreductase [Planctomycetaceae bacterium]